MPESRSSAFSEPEDYAAALRADGYRSLLVYGLGPFRARLTRISLDGLQLSAGEEPFSRVGFVGVPDDRSVLCFPAGSGTAPICGGIAVYADQLMTIGPGTEFHARTEGRSHWASLRLPTARLVEYGVALTGTALSMPPGVSCRRPRQAALRRLRSLHRAAIRMAARQPEMLVDAEGAHGLEQQLLDVVVECLAQPSLPDSGGGQGRDNPVMVRFERLLHCRRATGVSAADICRALQVSERRLRRLCAEHLGMSPVAYDRLRRLSLARRVLRGGGGAAGTVAAAARDCGFPDTGRFAIDYRRAFGETPSATVRRGSR